VEASYRADDRSPGGGWRCRNDRFAFPVFGVPDPTYGEEVSAAVVLKRRPAARSNSKSTVRIHPAHFKSTQAVHLVSAIPKNAMGKVHRRDLTALFS
jgi:acyl-coenzyme A synthetase/AMP-(fatty) acid ligase